MKFQTKTFDLLNEIFSNVNTFLNFFQLNECYFFLKAKF